MNNQYAFVYFIVNIVCFLSSLVILTRLSSNIGSETENKILRKMLFAYMAFLFFEIIWVLSEGGMFPMGGFITGLVKIMGTACIPIMVYFWLQYAEVSFENHAARTKKFKLLTAIPVIVMLIIYITSIWTGAVGRVDESGAVVMGPAIGITGLVDHIYGMAVVIHAVILLFKDKDGFKKRTYFTHILFIVICTIGGITDAIISNTPVMPLAIMLSMNVLFINLQESKIFNDALTGLNNRRLADRFISDAIKECSEDKPLCVFMMDIDKFKSANDSFGHIMGDKVLIATANALKEAANDYSHSFLARWGGDEFIVALQNADEKTIESFKKNMNDELDIINAGRSLPFDINMSIGQEICTNPNAALADVINKADERLYEDKGVNTSRVA